MILIVPPGKKKKLTLYEAWLSELWGMHSALRLMVTYSEKDFIPLSSVNLLVNPVGVN